jgi:hypothetical protein
VVERLFTVKKTLKLHAEKGSEMKKKIGEFEMMHQKQTVKTKCEEIFLQWSKMGSGRAL